MKKQVHLSIMLVALLFTPTVFAQNNYLQTGSKWRINSTGLSNVAPCYFTKEYVCEITGDTLIAGLTYKKLIYHGTKVEMPTGQQPNTTCESPSTFSWYYASIRQDSLKMYIYDGTQDVLLYDFDLQVGDTLPLSYNNYNDQLVIDSITTLQVGNETRKVFHFTQEQPEPSSINQIIEGIGHNWGLTGPMQIFEFFETSLVCFAINDTAYYPETGAACELNVGLMDHLAVVELNAFPNPTNGSILIETGGLNTIYALEMIDASGHVWSNFTTNEQENGWELNLQATPSGIYLLRMWDTEGQMGIVRVVKE